MAGKSVLGISLPVCIFDKRSNLERYCNSLCFANLILEKANAESDPLKMLKYAVALGISMSYLFIALEKPFNPILVFFLSFLDF